ncbi:MAG: beta-galactosidase [Phycisphaerae bacterium]
MLIFARSLQIGILLGWCAPGALAADASDPLAGWTFSNGREFPGAAGELKWNAAEGHEQPGCVELRFSFDKGGNYVAAMMSLPPDNDARRVRLWLKKPGTNRITFRAADHTGQTFQKYVDYTYPGWQQIEVDLSHWVHSWGGAKDGKVRWPITSFGVLIENGGDVRRGSCFIDDIEFLPATGGVRPARQETGNVSVPQDAEAASPGLRRSTYLATSFAADEGWYSHARPGCRFRDGTWTYDLPDIGTAAGIGNDFTLFGDPKRLRVRVLADGSGNELTITLGSHFQSFERSLGTLSRKGEQTFEVSLENLADWRHFGGENDGIRRLPLRVTHVGLVRRGAQARGEIRLVSMEAETAYPPENTVVLIPDGRAADGAARFQVVLRNLSDRPLNGKLVAEIRDLNGRLSLKTVPVHLAAAGAPTLQNVTASMKNREFLEAAFRFIAPGVHTPEASVTVVGIPEIPATPAVNPIGVGMYLYRQHGNPQSHKAMMDLADMARRAGVKWTREEIDWDVTEPEKGRYEWRFYDDLVKVANDHGIQVYGLLCYWPDYPGSDKIMYTEAGVKEYARWTAQVVRHYKDRIRHWEIWNEPNIFFWSGPKELYIEALKQACAAIRQEDPDAKVLGCSTAGIDAAFIRKVVDANAPFDILTIHPYRGSLNERAFIDELKRTQESVDGRPVWITEMGWPTSLADTSERRQAGLVARTYLSALASGVVGSVSWYDFRDDGNNPFYNEHRFGLIRTDLRPKAGYRALATIGHRLAWHEAVGSVDLGDDLLAFRFRSSGRPSEEDVIALWSSDEDRAAIIRTEPPATQACDAMGQPLPITQDGRLTVTLPAGMPIYLAGPRGMQPAREPLPVKITLDPAIARPGEAIRVRVEALAPWRGPTWQWPAEWQATESNKPQEWILHVPADQPQGRVGLVAEFRSGEQTLRIPAGLGVQPAILRL